VVVGAGPAGRCCALALARENVKTALVAPLDAAGGSPRDMRTAALFAGSVEFLRNLRVWDGCTAASAPILGIRVVDDLGGLLRSPEICFTAGDIGRATLGYNVPQQALVSAISTADEPNLTVFSGCSVVSAVPAEDSVLLTLSDGSQVVAQLAVAADGRRSIVRSAAGIEVDIWQYPQVAIACSFEHDRPHGGFSTELHRPTGPCTTVPLSGNASSLVWVESPAEAERLKGLGPSEFAAALERVLKGLLGGIRSVGPLGAFPLSALRAKPLALNRVALVGEAGHVIPPIGAQGLNLGLRDGATLAELVADAVSTGADPGGPRVLQAYDRGRSADVGTRVLGVDALNRSLLSSITPVHLLRGIGLHALKSVGPLRKALIREGLEPSGVTSRWLRPAASAAAPARHLEVPAYADPFAGA